MWKNQRIDSFLKSYAAERDLFPSDYIVETFFPSFSSLLYHRRKNTTVWGFLAPTPTFAQSFGVLVFIHSSGLPPGALWWEFYINEFHLERVGHCWCSTRPI